MSTLLRNASSALAIKNRAGLIFDAEKRNQAGRYTLMPVVSLPVGEVSKFAEVGLGAALSYDFFINNWFGFLQSSLINYRAGVMVSYTTHNFSGEKFTATTNIIMLDMYLRTELQVSKSFYPYIGIGGTPGNYSITNSGDLSVSAAAVSANQVTLTTSSHTSMVANGYTVTVTNVKSQDLSKTIVGPNNTADFTGDTLPEVVSLTVVDSKKFQVVFDQAMLMDTSAAGALQKTNYCIELNTDGTPQNCDNSFANIIGAPSQVNSTTVELRINTNMATGTVYRVTVLNVTDTTGNSINTSANTATMTGP